MKNGLLIVLTIALIATGAWGYNQYQLNQEQSLYLENQYQRMFHDMIASVENIQVNLSKTMVTGSPKQKVLLFSDIKRLSYDAQEKLSQLPIDHGDVSRTERFLSQVGDLSNALARKHLNGQPLTQEESNLVEELHNYSNYLAEKLISLQASITQEGVRIGELSRKSNRKLDKVNEHMITTSFTNVEERMKEYPELIYDGPFSEHMQKKKPRLTGRTIGKEEIERIAEEFMNDGTKYEATVLGDLNGTRMPAYILSLAPKNGEKRSEVSMAITKVGGKILWMLDTREVKDAKLSDKQGVKIAQDFLQEKGYENMMPTYSEKYDGLMVINFAYQEGEVTIYPDLMKVKVGLDDGKVVGFEADGFWSNHHERDIPTPKVSAQEAREGVGINAQVEEPRLAIIPTEGGGEMLCYEFKAQYKKDTFLIYVNAETGEEYRILQMIIKEDGVLMM